MTHTFLSGALFECENCGTEYEDHPSALDPHLCPRCEEARDDEERDAAFPQDGESELEMQDRYMERLSMSATQAPDEDRRYRRTVRNMRRASDIVGQMIGCDFTHRRGHVYRLVPAKVFDDAIDMLRRTEGFDGS